MPENSPNQVAITTNKTVPDQLRPEILQRNIQAQTSLNAFQKRQLTKQLFQATAERMREEFSASLEVDRYRLIAQVELVKNKIDVEKDTIALNIREAYLNTLATVGMRVEMAQLEFITEFGASLKAFRERLKLQNVDDGEKQRIMQMSIDSFDRVYRRLIDLTDRLKPAAAKE